MASNNYGNSELNLDHTETGQTPPDLLSPIPSQYIQSSNQIPSAPPLDPGTIIVPSEISLDMGLQQYPSSHPISTSLSTASTEGYEMAAWPYEPYCPIEDAYCCTGEYAPETNKFLDGCSPWKTAKVIRTAKREQCQEYCCADFLPDRNQGFDCVPGQTPWAPHG
ncbi:hypothetical protein MMC07_007966 [Pseudocyphellaria aurata]|nr:hypothetical protein [Pseudocyphellaria aurata]